MHGSGRKRGRRCATTSMDEAQQEKIATFQSIAGCDADFAASFLEAADWSLDNAVANFCEPSAAASSASGGGGAGGFSDGFGGAGGGGANPAGAGGFTDFGGAEPEERAPIAQFRDTLIDAGDPAMRMPQLNRTASASNHPLEAFRDFRSEGSGAGGSAGDEPDREVFGLPKRPKNLAEIYRAPTELCFVGSFDELRAAGKTQQRWLLVNIQSPTEFASQQLNADTWRDETLCAVLGASFLFWQQVCTRHSAPHATHIRRPHVRSRAHDPPPPCSTSTRPTARPFAASTGRPRPRACP